MKENYFLDKGMEKVILNLCFKNMKENGSRIANKDKENFKFCRLGK